MECIGQSADFVCLRSNMRCSPRPYEIRGQSAPIHTAKYALPGTFSFSIIFFCMQQEVCLTNDSEIEGQYGLQDQDRWHADDEVPVSGFVMEQVHAGQCSD